MKKLCACLLLVALMLTIVPVALADNTTVLTTTVPDATYTLNIPADQAIPFNATQTNIGNVTITDTDGFAVGKNVSVAIGWDEFACEEVSTTIPFLVKLCSTDQHFTGSEFNKVPTSKLYTEPLIFKGEADGSVGAAIYGAPTDGGGMLTVEGLAVSVSSADWGKALGGDYTATITFTSEIVAG